MRKVFVFFIGVAIGMLCYAGVVYAQANPFITTRIASDVGITTAQLNSHLDSDGASVCEVRWGYGNTSQPVNFDAYTSITTWDSGNYTTGQNPFSIITGLTSNTTYYYRVQARYDATHNYTATTERSFLTGTDVLPPSYFSGVPTEQTIILSWVRDGDAPEVVIQYDVGQIPFSNETGFRLYNGTASYYTHSGLTSGQTIGYMIWGYNNGVWSAGNATVLLMTTVALADTSDTLPDPSTPSRLFTEPDSSNLVGFPLYPLVNDTATSIGMTVDYLWFLISMILVLLTGLGTFRFSKSATIALWGIILATTVGYLQWLIPFYVMIIILILCLSIIGIKERA